MNINTEKSKSLILKKMSKIDNENEYFIEKNRFKLLNSIGKGNSYLTFYIFIIIKYII
jgi:hypothetical protein